MRPVFRKTKIICTIGPATSSYEMLRNMHEAGMDIIRLNMSHATHKWAERMIEHVVELNKHTPFPVGILLDTQGPEIRTGVRESDLDLKVGDIISITVRDGVDVEESSIRINYDQLLDTVNVGDKITVDNGLINLEVLEKNNNVMRCKVLDGGKLGSKKHVNLPGVRVNLPAITQKDREDIQFGLDKELDYIALSFVREANDVLQLRQLIAEYKPEKAHTIKIIAKIEDQQGVKNLEEIVQVADGIMVARGDLGVEIDLAELPNTQRRIVKLCAEYGKRVIVATHLLESMIENPIPTRAEVTDVANAVYEEADAIMLSGETTVGKHPLRCVRYMDSIARATEPKQGLGFTKALRKNSDKEHLAATAVELAESLGAQGIVVVTRHGIMANYVTNCHPQHTPIFAFTNIGVTRRIMTLNRYVYPFKIEFSSEPEITLARAFSELKHKAGFESGDKVVVISDLLIDQDSVGIQIRTLP
ncbi:MAG: pyruvate kinase [Pseudomonadales bacterium]|jgi:pyruvate kinase|nr:pyruvate kinase [Pseudomonadales bacterium]